MQKITPLSVVRGQCRRGRALSKGGEMRMPLDETFRAQRFAVFSDRFGVPWMVNCPKPE